MSALVLLQKGQMAYWYSLMEGGATDEKVRSDEEIFGNLLMNWDGAIIIILF